MGARHRVVFQPMGVAVQAEAGTTLGDLAPPGIPIRFDCGGKGVCGQCRVIAEPAAHLSPPSQAEAESLGPDVLARSVRLACQARIL
ncbi:MAG: (2Fe-2S)-binding protein, partial [Desulfobacteraceae bacterium]|nr:(2Fe-2S)-binding protein [Desulfobacteraceae bacterium]